MFENYRYFLTLAEELNVTRAAKRLFVTHQCLSRYLGRLEKECGTLLFQRKPVFALTPDGQKMLETLRRVELQEKNLHEYYSERQRSDAGSLRFGTTEGRFRIIVPDVISRFQDKFPHVQLHVGSANSQDLRQQLLDNHLDLILSGHAGVEPPSLENRVVLQEKIYLVISDGLLRREFGSEWKTRLKKMKSGADLRLFANFPFSVNMPSYNSSKMLQRHLSRLRLKLNVVHMSSHPDLHHILTNRDYAASFCLTMYIPHILSLNGSSSNKLHVLPIRGLTENNPIAVTFVKGRVLPRCGLALIDMLQQLCAEYSAYGAV